MVPTLPVSFITRHSNDRIATAKGRCLPCSLLVCGHACFFPICFLGLIRPCCLVCALDLKHIVDLRASTAWCWGSQCNSVVSLRMGLAPTSTTASVCGSMYGQSWGDPSTSPVQPQQAGPATGAGSWSKPKPASVQEPAT